MTKHGNKGEQTWIITKHNNKGERGDQAQRGGGKEGKNRDLAASRKVATNDEVEDNDDKVVNCGDGDKDYITLILIMVMMTFTLIMAMMIIMIMMISRPHER